MDKIKREKNDKGITLIALIITLLVLAIIAGIGVSTGIQTTDSIKLKNFYDELQLIQTRVDVIYEQILSGEKTVEDLGGETYANRQGIMDRTFNAINDTSISRAGYRYYTKQSLNRYLGIEDVSQSVLINWITRDVISVEGIKIDGVRYYRYEGTYRPKPLYQQLEYIESTGTQYIDTEYIPNINTRYELDAQFTNISGSKEMCNGTTNSSTNIGHNYFRMGIGTLTYNYNSSYPANWYFAVANTNNYPLGKDNDRHLFYIDLSTGNYGVDNINYNTSVSQFEQTNSLYLFARHSTITTDDYCHEKIYGCKLYENGILVRDLVPCYRKSDNKTGMYDLVNGVFYQNKGTGEFIKGPEVVNSKITEKDDINLTLMKEKEGDIKKVTATVVTTDDNTPVSNFTLKYKLEDEDTWKIADGNYFETANSGRYVIQVSGNGINTEEKNISIYDFENYQAVEYIESTGTQYIDTGYIPNIKTSVKCKLNYADNTAFGSEGEISSNTFAVAGAVNKEYVRFLKESGDILMDGLTSTSIYELEINPKQTIYKNSNGTIQITSYSSTGTSTRYTLYLFARNLRGTVQEDSYSKRKIYNFKIYEDGILVRDFIPCYRKSDTVVGMYDAVNDVFYTDAGTGTDAFLKGEDIQ